MGKIVKNCSKLVKMRDQLIIYKIEILLKYYTLCGLKLSDFYVACAREGEAHLLNVENHANQVRVKLLGLGNAGQNEFKVFFIIYKCIIKVF